MAKKEKAGIRFNLKSMDILAASEKGIEFEVMYKVGDGISPSEYVLDENGEKISTGVVIHVVGIASRKAKQAQAEYRNKLELLEKQGKEVTAEENAVFLAELLAGYTVGWKNFFYDDVEYEFTPEVAADLYHKLPLVAEQLFAVITDSKAMLSNFS